LTEINPSDPSQTPTARRFLLGPPLIIVALFCFSFTLFQAHQAKSAASLSASKHVAHTVDTRPPLSTSAQEVPVLPNTSLTDPPADSQPGSATPTSSLPTSNPQPNSASSSNLQAAVPNPGPSSTSNDDSKTKDKNGQLLPLSLPKPTTLLHNLAD